MICFHCFQKKDKLITITVQLRFFNPLNIVLNIDSDVEVSIKTLVAQGWE